MTGGDGPAWRHDLVRTYLDGPEAIVADAGARFPIVIG
jgi:hypothetical protein